MSDTLKPCPFCGGEAERPRPNDPHGGMVQCVSCGASAFGPKWNARTQGNLLDGGRPLPYDRDTLGRFVREAWVRWAETQPNPKLSWTVPYDDLSEPDKEADRQIGEAVARWTLIGDAGAASAALIEALEALEMVRDADDDCRKEGFPTIPPLARARIDAAISRASLPHKES
jgi:restriction alleviation protein Lar